MIRRQKRMKTSQIDAAMEMLRSAGRRGDTELAHVNPREKAILKAMGGAGSRNPRTGLREYYDASMDPDYISPEDLRRIDEAEASSLRAMDAESMARSAGSAPKVIERHKSAYDEAYRILHDLISEVANKGRYGDTEVVPTTPRDRAILKGLGGAGTVNPRTGLREYYAGAEPGGDFSVESAMAGEGTNVGTSGLGTNATGVDTETPFGPEQPTTMQNVRGYIGQVLEDPDSIPGLGVVGMVLGQAMSGLSRAAREAGYDVIAPGGARPGRSPEQAAREQALFEAGFPGNRSGGDNIAMALGAIPVSAPTPTPQYLRGGQMAAPQEISSFIGPGMSDLQQRALISTYGTQGVNSAFRTDPVRRYYANLLSRGLISDAGAPVQNPYVLPIEQQYASQVLGRPMTNPSDAAAAYESIRGLL